MREFETDDDFDRDSAIVIVLTSATNDRFLPKVRWLPDSGSRINWSEHYGCVSRW